MKTHICCDTVGMVLNILKARWRRTWVSATITEIMAKMPEGISLQEVETAISKWTSLGVIEERLPHRFRYVQPHKPR